MKAPVAKPLLNTNRRLLWAAGILFSVLWTALIGWQTVTHFPWDLQTLLNMFFLNRRPFPGWAAWVQHAWGCIKNWLLLAGFGCSAYGLGTLLLEKVFPSVRSRLEGLLYSLGLGFACQSLVLFGLGSVGWLRPGPWGSIFGLTAAWGLVMAWHCRDRLRPGQGWLLGKWSWAEAALLGVLGLALGLILVAVNTPEIFFDSLVYHLAVPAQWIQAGGIRPLPYNFFSAFPMGIEMLYSGALLLSDERLCRLLHAGLGLLAVLAIFCLGRRWLGRRAGLWGAAMVCATPLVVINLSEAGVDAASVFFSILGLSCMWNLVLAKPGASAPRFREFLLAGLFMGLAVACKYNQVFMLAPATAVALVLAWRRGWRLSILNRAIFMLGLGGLAMLLPWWGKNVAFTGNPVYPFLYQYFPSPLINPEKMKQQMDGFREFSHRSLTQYLRQPWDLTFYYPTGNSYLGTVYLLLLPGVLLIAWQSRRGPPCLQVLLAAAFLAVLIWSGQTQITRYLMPTLPLLALLGAQALETWEQRYWTVGRLLRWAVVGMLFWGVGVTMGIAGANWDPVPAALGLENRWAYLDRMLMNSYAPMIRNINALPLDSKVMFFGETRAFYCQRAATVSTVYDYQPLLEWTAHLPSADAVWKRLREQGYTHVFVHAAEAARTRGYETYHWQAPAVERWQELFARYLKPVAVIGQQRLYAVLAAPRLQVAVKTGRPLYTYDPETVSSALQHYQQAIMAIQQNRVYDAQAEWMRIQELAPQWETPVADLGWLYFQMQRPEEGLASYQKADSLGLLDPGAYNFAAEQCMRLGRFGEAKRYFRQALEQEPGLQSARENLERIEKSEKEGGK